jgi:hypothetical protein
MIGTTLLPLRAVGRWSQICGTRMRSKVSTKWSGYICMPAENRGCATRRRDCTATRALGTWLACEGSRFSSEAYASIATRLPHRTFHRRPSWEGTVRRNIRVIPHAHLRNNHFSSVMCILHLSLSRWMVPWPTTAHLQNHLKRVHKRHFHLNRIDPRLSHSQQFISKHHRI